MHKTILRISETMLPCTLLYGTKERGWVRVDIHRINVTKINSIIVLSLTACQSH